MENNVLNNIVKILAVLLIGLSTKVSAEEVLVFGRTLHIESALLKETRDYHVYLPASYENSDNVFPVVYLLDGDVHRLKAFSGVLEGLSTETLGNQVLQAIVVAIPNTHRSRDLTPTQLSEWKFEERVLDRFEQSGGADRFAAFLQEELFKVIEKKFRTSECRVLVAESFGGLFGAHVLLTKPSMFTDYLLIDPTAVWDSNYLNRVFDARKGGNDKTTSNFYFGFANNSHIGKLGRTNYQWGSDFASKLIELNSAPGQAKQQYFEHETHGTVAIMAWYNGLKFLLANTTN